uniref:Uncharacterized protein n=1 Tax=Ditylenchus dipsaci TaxID=166011 RepID=A0A915CU33_9BILA
MPFIYNYEPPRRVELKIVLNSQLNRRFRVILDNSVNLEVLLWLERCSKLHFKSIYFGVKFNPEFVELLEDLQHLLIFLDFTAIWQIFNMWNIPTHNFFPFLTENIKGYRLAMMFIDHKIQLDISSANEDLADDLIQMVLYSEIQTT